MNLPHQVERNKKNQNNGRLEFVHPSIAKVLSLERETTFTSTTTTTTVSNRRSPQVDCPEINSLEDLMELAHECDQHIFGNHLESHDVPLQDDDHYSRALAKFALRDDTLGSQNTYIAALLAVNALESTIRIATGHSTGKAPMLKTMIAEIRDSKDDDESKNRQSLRSILERLLTPNSNSGLNLRNILWHGFVVELPRPWLALILWTTQELRKQYPASSSSKDTNAVHSSGYNVRDVPAFVRLLDDHPVTCKMPPPLLTAEGVPWLPDRHHELYTDILQPWIQAKQSPATCCALLSVLLEHGLRLDWCRANDCPQHSQARPQALYVTLDGHGQRQNHDLILYPYLLENGSANALFLDESKNDSSGVLKNRLPASTVAFLTDLFCSPCGGPNLRAALSHGIWDEFLQREWVAIHDDKYGGNDNEIRKDTIDDAWLWDLVQLLLLAMNSAATSTPLRYRPAFSYTSVTQRSLECCRKTLHHLLFDLHSDSRYQEHSETARSLLDDESFQNGNTPVELLVLSSLNDDNEPTILSADHCLLGPIIEGRSKFWSSSDVLEEHILNQKLASVGILRSLLEDLAVAGTQLVQDCDDALTQLSSPSNLSQRQRKSLIRLACSNQKMALNLYILAYNFAVLSLSAKLGSDNDEVVEEQDDLIQALRRSRMVVSTTQTFLRTNVDRCSKAIREFTKNKAVKKFAEKIRHDSSQI